MNQIQQNLKKIIKNSPDRFQFWSDFINQEEIINFTEIGVYKGEFAEFILSNCSLIERYYMIDPWRNLTDWNKPSNTSDEEFQNYFNITLSRTDLYKNKRKVLRGKTAEVIGEILEESLDMAYIDGDHTLKGITIDLLNTWGKIKPDGFIAGDDFCNDIWQHDKRFEPTLVYPFSVYFAEAMNVKIFALPFNQFLISKGLRGFEFIDLTDQKYGDFELRNQFRSLKEKKKNRIYQRLIRRLNG